MKEHRRRTQLTPEKLKKFLDILAQGLSVTNAAEAIVASRERLYELRRANPDLAAAWDAAIEAGTDKLEDEARRRALEGVSEPVFWKGEQVALVRKYSDLLLIFLLKARRPDKYRERSETRIGNLDGGPITFTITQGAEAED